MSLYPTISEPDQHFRLASIKEHDAFLAKEAETRRILAKKYQRAVNTVDGVSLGLTVAVEAAGAALMLTGIGAIPGVALVNLGTALWVPNIWLNRKFSRKGRKHALIMQCALDKRASIHRAVSEALRDGSVSAEEYDNIIGEVEQYNAMKRELQHKTRSEDVVSKKEWLEKGREEARAEFAKYLSGGPAKQ